MKRLALFSLLLFLLTACTPAPAAQTSTPIPPANTPTDVPSPEPTETQAPAPTSFMLPNPTPHPTLPSSKALQLLEAMQDESCKLPCFLGIIPGQTTLLDARRILSELGGSGLGKFQRETDGAFDYSYSFNIGDQLSGEKVSSYSISLITDNEIVQVVKVSASTYWPRSTLISIEIFRKYWQRYSARQIFLQLGEPDGLSVNRIESDSQRGAELMMLYEKENIAIVIDGTAQENHLCPKNEATSLYEKMLISYPGATVDIYGAGGIPLSNQETYPPIEDVYGVSARQFYYSVNSDPSVCWEPKEEVIR